MRVQERDAASSGSNRSNRPFHRIATMAGAAMSWGKRASGVAFQFAPLDRAAHQRPERRDRARQHLAVVELGELREALAFGQDQPDHVLAPRLVDLAHEQVERVLGDRAAPAGPP